MTLSRADLNATQRPRTLPVVEYLLQISLSHVIPSILGLHLISTTLSWSTASDKQWPCEPKINERRERIFDLNVWVHFRLHGRIHSVIARSDAGAPRMNRTDEPLYLLNDEGCRAMLDEAVAGCLSSKSLQVVL